MSRPPSDLPQRAVQAAMQLAGAAGVRHVTFDAVAAAIGASKGAVLHHFPTKGDLIDAMVRALVAIHRDAVEAARAQDPNPIGAYARAMLEVATPSDRQTERGLISALLDEPARATAMREHWAWCHERLAEDGIPPAHVAVIMLASDGAWFTELLGLPLPPADAMRDAQRLLEGLTRRT